MRPKRPLFEQLLEQHERRHPPVVVPDHVRHIGGLDRFHHGPAFGSGAAERLFAEHHLAGPGRGDGDLSVSVVGAGDVDEVDVLALDQDTPVRLDGLVAPVLSKTFCAFCIAGTDCLEYRLIRHIEKARGLKKRIGVRAAHEAVSDEANVQSLPCHSSLLGCFRLVPAMRLSNGEQGAEHILPCLGRQHGGVREHAAVPADVLIGTGWNAVRVAHP